MIKQQTNFSGGGNSYEAPTLEWFDVRVEQGFAVSGLDYTGDYEDYVPDAKYGDEYNF